MSNVSSIGDVDLSRPSNVSSIGDLDGRDNEEDRESAGASSTGSASKKKQDVVYWARISHSVFARRMKWTFRESKFPISDGPFSDASTAILAVQHSFESV